MKNTAATTRYIGLKMSKYGQNLLKWRFLAIFSIMSNPRENLKIIFKIQLMLVNILDASLYVYKRLFLSVSPLVGPSVRNAFVKIDEKWTCTESK